MAPKELLSLSFNGILKNLLEKGKAFKYTSVCPSILHVVQLYLIMEQPISFTHLCALIVVWCATSSGDLLMKAATSSHTRGIVAGSFLPREQPRANSLASSERASLMSSSNLA